MIIPTCDRPKDLRDLFLTILNQSLPPVEVIVIDSSQSYSGKRVVESYSLRFKSKGCKIVYVKSREGLAAARNLGVRVSTGEIIVFLDDDTLLDRNAIKEMALFMKINPFAMGLQPKIIAKGNVAKTTLAKKFKNSVYKALMLSYQETNKQTVRKSGASVFPGNLTEVIHAQRLSGCCSCYRREVFSDLCFDTNLKRWASKEDLDFSYRVAKIHPDSLYVIPHAKTVHKISEIARLPEKLNIRMLTVYWSYVFFKDICEHSVSKITAFLWGLAGNVIVCVAELLIKRKAKKDWLGLVYLLESYLVAFRNLRNIRAGKLDFFNKTLSK